MSDWQTLPVQRPYCATWVFDFLAQRALPRIEQVTGLCYERRLSATGETTLQVRWHEDSLQAALTSGDAQGDGPGLDALLPRIRTVFDTQAPASAIEAVLAEDPLLAEQLAQSPGLRVPGAWDGFEIAVRAILGQQVSVARARELAIALCDRFGDGWFPKPSALADADVSAIGMPGQRGAAVRALAQAVADGALVLEAGADAEALRARLVALPGIGPWTAGYVTMRVARDPDAYADADWVLLKMLDLTPAKARLRAQQWRPYRAYGLMLLWAKSAGFAAPQSAE